MEKMMNTFVIKGLIRHSFVQKIVLFFVKAANKTQIQKLLEDIQQNYLALLGSRDGMAAACILFTAADHKQRKSMLKMLKTEHENLVDNMITNQLGTVFLLKVLFTMDDTKMTCKIIIDRILEYFEDMIENPAAIRMISGLCAKNIKSYYANEDYELLTYTKHTSSKKDEKVRRDEILSYFVAEIKGKMQNLLEKNLENQKFLKFVGEFFGFIVEGNCIENKGMIETLINAIEPKIYENAIQNLLMHIMRIEQSYWETKEKSEREYSFGKEICKFIQKDFKAFIECKGVFLVCLLLKCDELRDKVSN